MCIRDSSNRPPTGQGVGMRSILDILDDMIISGVEGIDYTVLEDDTISGDMNRDEL